MKSQFHFMASLKHPFEDDGSFWHSISAKAMKLFSLLVATVCVFSGTFATPIWSLFGGDSSVPKGPRPEIGECSFFDPTNLFYSAFDGNDLIAFHRTAPIGSYLTVTNEYNNKVVRVRVVSNTMPLADGRVMELSPAAFGQISRLSEAAFDCQVTGAGGTGGYSSSNPLNMGGGGGGYIPGSGYQRPPSVLAGGVGNMGSQFGTAGYENGNARPYPYNAGNPSGSGLGGMGYQGTGTHAAGAGYDFLNQGQTDGFPLPNGGTMNTGFGPPPSLTQGTGGGGYGQGQGFDSDRYYQSRDANPKPPCHAH